MQDTLPDGKPVPEGIEFLSLIWDQENRCEAETDKRIPKMGEKAPQCLDNLAAVMSLLDRATSCWWGCHGEDHTIEYLAGRVYSSARASLRLLHFGFYDESLSITRSIGEIANLLFVFFNDANTLAEWKAADRKTRLAKFSPFKVRTVLARLRVPLPMDEDRYSKLCEIATHPTPETKPQAHNIRSRSVLGGVFQEVGALISLNELAAAVALATYASGRLFALDEEKRRYIRSAALKLLRSVGSIDVVQMPELWQKLRNADREESS